MRTTAGKVRRRLSERFGPDQEPERLALGSRQLEERIRELEERVQELERQLTTRIDQLHDGLQEQRGLNQRIAVLGDLVAEVVSAGVRGDREDLEAALARYADGL